MPKPVIKFFSALVILFLSTFVFYLTINVFQILSINYLEDLVFDAIFYRTLNDALLYFPGNMLGAILVTYGFWVKVGELPTEKDGSLSGRKTLIQMLIPILLGILLFTLSQYLFLPELNRIEQNLDIRSRLGLQLYDEIDAINQEIDQRLEFERNQTFLANPALSEQASIAAEESLTRLFFALTQLNAIIPQNEELIRQTQTIGDRLEERTFLRLLRRGSVSDEPNYRPLEKTEGELMALAVLANSREDYEAANELAYQVAWSLELRPPAAGDEERIDRRTQARELLESTYEKLQALRISEAAREQRLYFFNKNRILGQWESGLVREAYYGFLELQSINSSDPDVLRYLRETKEAMDQLVIFEQDLVQHFYLQMQNADDPDSSTRVVFKQENDADDLILIGFEGMVSVSSGVFFRDIEVKATNKDGGVLYHFYAPYGRWQDFKLQMETLDQFDWNQDYLPKNLNALAGAIGRPMSNREAPFQGSYEIPMPYTPNTLLFLAEKGQYVPSITELWENTTQLEEMGHSALPYQAAFMEKILSPFMLFALTYFAIFLARRLRSKYLGYPPFHLLMALLFLPIILHFAWTFYIWGQKLIMAYLILIFGLGWAIPIVTVSILLSAILFIYQAYAIFLPRK
jgi:hypothetical protein